MRARRAGQGGGKASSFPVSPCPSACLRLPHLCLLRSQPALLQEPGQRERATSGGLFVFPLDWCRGSQTLMDPEALPVRGELVEPDPAAHPLPSLLAVICPPLWLTSPHDPQSLACPEGFQTRSAMHLAMHLSLRQPTLLLENPWVSRRDTRCPLMGSGLECTSRWKDGPTTCLKLPCVSVSRGHLTRDPNRWKRHPPLSSTQLLGPASSETPCPSQAPQGWDLGVGPCFCMHRCLSMSSVAWALQFA